MNMNWPPKPKSLSERGYRKYMSKTKNVLVNGQQFMLQSVSPSFYYTLNDECGMTGGKKDSPKYLDTMFKNCVISPGEIKVEGLAYFDAREDLKTAEGLLKEIETFLREPAQYQPGATAGTKE